jgi:DnaJ-domain-containing protein 1
MTLNSLVYLSALLKTGRPWMPAGKNSRKKPTPTNLRRKVSQPSGWRCSGQCASTRRTSALKDPLRRAAYLCELHGAPIQAHDNTAMPPAFLMQQMEWREALEDASTSAAVDALEDEVMQARKAGLARCEALIDQQGDYPAAAQQVRALMFIARFADDIDRRREQLGQ